MIILIRYLLLPLVLILLFCDLNGQAKVEAVKLENPVSVKYLKTHLRKQSPRLILTPSVEKTLKKKVVTDPLVKNYFEAFKFLFFCT